jgi:hypothetical protein
MADNVQNQGKSVTLLSAWHIMFHNEWFGSCVGVYDLSVVSSDSHLFLVTASEQQGVSWYGMP